MASGSQGGSSITSTWRGLGEPLYFSKDTKIQDLTLQIRQHNYDVRLVFGATIEEHDSVLKTNSTRQVGRLCRPLPPLKPDDDQEHNAAPERQQRGHGSSIFIKVFLNGHNKEDVVNALVLQGFDEKAKLVSEKCGAKSHSASSDATITDIENDTADEMDEPGNTVKEELIQRYEKEISLSDVLRIAEFLEGRLSKSSREIQLRSIGICTEHFKLPLKPFPLSQQVSASQDEHDSKACVEVPLIAWNFFRPALRHQLVLPPLSASKQSASVCSIDRPPPSTNPLPPAHKQPSLKAHAQPLLKPSEQPQPEILLPSVVSRAEALYNPWADIKEAAEGTVYTIVKDTINPFQNGKYLPLPPAEAVQRHFGKGGNGIVTTIYHGGREFACKRTHLRQAEWNFFEHAAQIPKLRDVLVIPWAIHLAEKDPKRQGRRFSYHYMDRAQADAQTKLNELGQGALSNLLMQQLKIGGDLQLIVNNTRELMKGILGGMVDLHAAGYVHGDIKLSNLLLFMPTGEQQIFMRPKNDPPVIFKLTDFDSTSKADDDKAYNYYLKRWAEGKPIGTPGYYELLFYDLQLNQPTKHRTKMDIWSFGFTTVKLFTGLSGIHNQAQHARLRLFMQHGGALFPDLTTDDERKRLEEKIERLEETRKRPEETRKRLEDIAKKELWKEKRMWLKRGLKETIYEDLKLCLIRRVYPDWSQLALFIALCLVPKPETRPSAKELLDGKLYGVNAKTRLAEIKEWIAGIFPSGDAKMQNIAEKEMTTDKLHDFWES